MRDTDHDHSDETTRVPGVRRPDGRLSGLVLEAAAEGRSDVLGVGGLTQLQRAAGNLVTTAVAEERSPVLDVIGRSGQPLDDATRVDMEDRIGADFSDVRIHTDPAASESARSVGAHAYTVGSDVVFQQGRFDPSSHEGRTTLAHELTHVVQQRSGPVDGAPTGGGVSLSDPGDPFERAADDNAARVMASPVPVAGAQRVVAQSDTNPNVQRDGDERHGDEDEEVQAVRDPNLQRDGEEEQDQLT